MSYINVDQPKFFINELQFQDSIDNLETSIFIHHAWYHGEYSTLPIYNHPEKIYEGLMTYVNTLFGYLCISLKEGYWNDILLPQDDSGNDEYGSWAGNFGTRAYADLFSILSSDVPFTDDSFIDATVNLNMEVISYHESLQNLINSVPFENSTHGFGVTAHVGGFNMMKNIKEGLVNNCKTLVVRVPANKPMGCLCIGNYYTPQHSPDSGYDISHTHDGTKFITTRGGSTFSNTYYSGPPLWAGGGAAWELGYYEDEFTNYIRPSPVRRNGRRIYGFDWTGMVDTSLMPLNSLRSTYVNENESFNSLDFYTQVLKKTLNQSFIFTPNGSSLDPESFMFARWDDPEIEFNQMSHKLYNFSKTIVESW